MRLGGAAARHSLEDSRRRSETLDRRETGTQAVADNELARCSNRLAHIASAVTREWATIHRRTAAHIGRSTIDRRPPGFALGESCPRSAVTCCRTSDVALVSAVSVWDRQLSSRTALIEGAATPEHVVTLARDNRRLRRPDRWVGTAPVANVLPCSFSGLLDSMRRRRSCQSLHLSWFHPAGRQWLRQHLNPSHQRIVRSTLQH